MADHYLLPSSSVTVHTCFTEAQLLLKCQPNVCPRPNGPPCNCWVFKPLAKIKDFWGIVLPTSMAFLLPMWSLFDFDSGTEWRVLWRLPRDSRFPPRSCPRISSGFRSSRSLSSRRGGPSHWFSTCSAIYCDVLLVIETDALQFCCFVRTALFHLCTCDTRWPL